MHAQSPQIYATNTMCTPIIAASPQLQPASNGILNDALYRRNELSWKSNNNTPQLRPNNYDTNNLINNTPRIQSNLSASPMIRTSSNIQHNAYNVPNNSTHPNISISNNGKRISSNTPMTPITGESITRERYTSPFSSNNTSNRSTSLIGSPSNNSNKENYNNYNRNTPPRVLTPNSAVMNGMQKAKVIHTYAIMLMKVRIMYINIDIPNEY